MDSTKVTIIVDGLGKQEITLDKRAATEIYVAASKGIIDKLMPSYIGHNECTCHGSCDKGESMEDKAKTTLLVGYAEKGPINQPLEKGIEMSERVHPGVFENRTNHVAKLDIEELEDKPYPFDHEMFKRPRLVAYRCPECGKVTIRMLNLSESNEATCHWCKETAIIEDVVQGEMQCACCDRRTVLMFANGLSEVTCIQCESPIDIMYFQDGNKRRAVSANLMK